MKWQQLIEDPAFSNQPYDVETNEYGQIIMTPVNDNHAYFAAEIAVRLKHYLPDGIVQVETPLTTRRGTKSPDVTWCSKSVHNRRKNTSESPIAPEICVEVLSPGNSPAEIEEKIRLYFEQGAEEVWICSEQGELIFHTRDTPKVPEFPDKIEL